MLFVRLCSLLRSTCLLSFYLLFYLCLFARTFDCLSNILVLLSPYLLTSSTWQEFHVDAGKVKLPEFTSPLCEVVCWYKRRSFLCHISSVCIYISFVIICLPHFQCCVRSEFSPPQLWDVGYRLVTDGTIGRYHWPSASDSIDGRLDICIIFGSCICHW